MFGRRKNRLAVALTCADWRIHNGRVDLNRRLARLLGVDGVDVVAVPGPDGLLRGERESEWRVAVEQIKLLIGVHDPEALAVVGHQRCAGHPVTDEEHDKDVLATAKALKASTGFPNTVFALVTVYRRDLKWDLREVDRV